MMCTYFDKSCNWPSGYREEVKIRDYREKNAYIIEPLVQLT